MPKLKVLTSRKVITLLKKRGFVLARTTGSHYIFFHPLSKRQVTVPYHTKDLPKGTLLSILDMAGIDKREL
jgi:predicted RNA binding protein YcfA (HicA-like mRNA interferase family)